MTANEFASLLNARRIGPGRWMAKCPGHPDRTPSLSIATGRDGRCSPLALKGQSHNQGRW